MADAAAPTERAPSVAPGPPPSHGAALSVLWWRDPGAADKDDEDKPETD